MKKFTYLSIDTLKYMSFEIRVRVSKFYYFLIFRKA